MEPSNYQQQCKDYQRIEKALHFAAENFREHPPLAELAASVHLSEHHFQRIFRRWAGVSPKQFLQYLTVQHARQCLASHMTVLDTAYDSGLAAPSRLCELFVRLESLTPAEYKSAGAGLVVDYGFHDTPFGQCLIGTTQRGITHLAFLSDANSDANSDAASFDEASSDAASSDTASPVTSVPSQAIEARALDVMRNRLPGADYRRSETVTAACVQQIFARQSDHSLTLLVGGSAFQVKVWEAMLRIEPRKVTSYQQLAQAIDKPKAVRAVGTAVGQNPVALLIPCHRVIRSNGMLGDYRWGAARKLAVQGWEHHRLTYT